MIKNNDILKSFWACQIDINKTMIFESANQTVQEKAFMHGLVNTCMPIIYTPGTYASFFLQRTAFIENTTLRGVRNVLPSQRPNVSRVVWTVVMLTFGAFFICSFPYAANKYLQYHTVTSITKNYEQNMSFPALSICPDNLFSRGKIIMRDDDPFFAAQGLNMSACEVTRELRQREMNNMSCGLAMICCCAFFGYKTNPIYYSNCTKQRRSALQKVIEESGVLFNMEEFFTVFSPDPAEMLSHYFRCLFQWSENCSHSDFETDVTRYGICHTFNSGKNN